MHEPKQLQFSVDPIPGVPQQSARFVERPRLDATLDGLLDGSYRAITVWSAAGSGKTTLLAHWARRLAAAGLEVTWISGEALGKELAVLKGIAEPDADRPAHEHSNRRIVIVDDMHLLSADRSKSAMDALVESLPTSAGLIIAGRYQPFAGPLALHAAGAVAELRTSELSFTCAELNALARCHDVELDDAVVEVLLRRTAGWATALTLAVPWLKGQNDPQAAVLGFDGDHRAVADYLMTEVLQSLGADETAALSRTAIRSDVPFELANYLAGMPNTGELLHRIAHRNSLLVEDTDGYRYHPVLLSFLQAGARRKDAPAFAEAHARAFKWFAAREDGANALAEATASALPDTMHEAIEAFGLDLLLAGETELVTNAVSAMPAHSPPVALVAMNLLLEAPNFVDAARAAHLFAIALKHDVEGTPTRDRWLAVAIAVHCLSGQSPRVLAERLKRLRMDDIAALRRDSLALDLLALTAEAWCIGRSGDPAEALRMLREVGVSTHRAGYSWLHLIAAEYAAQVATFSGRWETAAVLEDEITAQVLTGPHLHLDWVRSAAKIMSAARSYRRCEPMCLEELDEIIEADACQAAHGTLVPAIALRTFPALDSEANPRAALETIGRLLRENGERYPRLFSSVALRTVSLHLQLDGRSEAQESANEFFAALGPDTLEAESIRFALSLPSRAGDAAEAQLISALGRKSHTWHAGAPVGAWLLLAQSAEAQGRHSEADTRLAKALRMAHRFGAVHPFAARGGEGATLLGSRIGRFGHLDGFATHVHDLVRALLPTVHASPSRIETLTAREREILNELPAHQSVAEIARKQTLSINTVKTHLRSIYQKLGVSDRSEAVSVAQRRGLL